MKNTVQGKGKIVIARIVLLVLIVSWCTLIFCMSGETAEVSSERSAGLAKRIVRTLVAVFGGDVGNEQLIDTCELLLRKGAHMFSYFILALLSTMFFCTFDIKQVVKYTCSFAFTLLYSVSDEIHQTFVPGRSGNVADVFIDMTGAGLCIFLLYLILRIKNKKSIHNKTFL